MNGPDDRLLAALRRLRAIGADEPELGRRLLEVVLATVEGTSATLRSPMVGFEEVRTGREPHGERRARLEQRFATRSGVAILAVERRSTMPFDDGEARTLEALGGEVALRLDQARVEAEANALRRQIELLRALSRSGDGAAPLTELANRAAVELLDAFTGAHVLVHVLRGSHLELAARRTEDGDGMADAPDWVRQVPTDGPTAFAVAVREKRAINRRAADAIGPARAFLEERGVHNMLVAPLSAHDVVLGTVMVAHRQERPWTAESLRLLESVAAQLGVEVANARLLEAERQRAADLGLVNEIGTLVSQHLELRGVLTAAARKLVSALDVPRAEILIADEAKTHLRGVSTTENAVVDFELPLESSYAVTPAFRTMTPVLIEDAEADPRTNKALVSKLGPRSLAVFPLVARGEAIGVIVLAETRRRRAFTETEVARVLAVGNVVAPAVTNAKMFEDLRRSYEAHAKAQAELVRHERLAALGELSAVIAHEVRNPVAIIFNSLAELRRLSAPGPEATLLLGIVGEEAARLNRIVGDLLDFVRPYDPHPRLVELEAIVRGAVDAARRAAPEPCVDIRTEVPPSPCELFVDETMLQQALLNLVVNAIQATPKGRSVTVRADVVAAASGASLRCEVADEGPGIDQVTSARIFQPFFTTKATGTGLGLALVRRLADALGGSVSAESRPAGGALFALTVPIARSAPAP